MKTNPKFIESGKQKMRNFAFIIFVIEHVLGYFAMMDISKRDDVVYVQQHGNSDVQKILYIQRNNDFVVQVMDGNTHVWSGSQNVFCRKIYLYKLRGVNKLACLTLTSKECHIYFLYFYGLYIEIGFKDYSNIFDRLIEEKIFDILAPVDRQVFMVSNYRPADSNSLIYVPYSGVNVIKIKEGSKTIWNRKKDEVNGPSDNTLPTFSQGELQIAKNNKRLESFVIHGAPGALNLLHAFVKEGQGYRNLYFSKDDGEWKRISNIIFYAKLGILDAETENKNIDSEILRIKEEAKMHA